ncbi:MAG: CBS domain-containing protein [Planctomycetota bacterium]|jgi:acetoin utilization protein AcuB
MIDIQYRLIDLIDDMRDGKDVIFQSIRTADDIMTFNVKTLTLDDTIETCLEFMEDNNIRHVPVMDVLTEKEEKPYFVGVVSQRDVFRQVSPYLGKVGEEKTDSKALQQQLGQIVTRNPKSVSPETGIPEMITIMVDHHIDMLPVIVKDDIVGIVTTADFIKLFVRLDAIRLLYINSGTVGKNRRLVDLLAGGSDDVAAALSSVLRKVEDIMTEDVVCLKEQDKLAKAMKVMQKGRFRHVPVVDKDRTLLGIISDRDILRYLPMRSRQHQKEAGVFRSRLFDVDPEDSSLELPLSHIMSRHVFHVLPNCSFYEAVKMMDDKKINCLPVVDEEKNLHGIITVTDVMRGLLAACTLTAKSRG